MIYNFEKIEEVFEIMLREDTKAWLLYKSGFGEIYPRRIFIGKTKDFQDFIKNSPGFQYKEIKLY